MPIQILAYLRSTSFIGSRALSFSDRYCHLAWNSVGGCACVSLPS